MGKIVASDYKGKWFVLQDEDVEDEYDLVRDEIDVHWVMGEGLQEHVENCRYYGIPAYIGKNEELKAKIKKIEDEFDI